MTSPWFRIPRRNGQVRSAPGRLRLFCFVHAGAGASVYRQWPQFLPAEVECVAVQLPGREERFSEPPHQTLASLVEALVPQIKPLLATPYAFFGHSMGALLAYELARALQTGFVSSPVRLFASGRRAPHLPSTDPPLARLDREEFREELQRLRGTQGAGGLAHDELFELMLPVLRADFEICESYQFVPGPPLQCPITVLGGTADPYTPESDLRAWSQHTSSGCHLHLIDGDHFFVESQRPTVVGIVSRELVPQGTPAAQ